MTSPTSPVAADKSRYKINPTFTLENYYYEPANYDVIHTSLSECQEDVEVS